MIEITRKEYDPLGTENILGIPYKVVTKEYDGSVVVGGVSISDAYNISEFTIQDEKSKGVLSLLSNVLKVLELDRITTDVEFTNLKVYGHRINEYGEAEIDQELIEEELTKVELEGPIVLDGISIDRVYKSSEDLSVYNSNIITICNRVEETACYSLIPSEKANRFASILLPESKQFSDESNDEEPIYLLYAFTSTLNVDEIILCVFKFGINANNLLEIHAGLLAEWPPLINSLMNTGKRNWLVTNGNAYINTNFIPNSESTVIADMFVSKTANCAWFGAAVSNSQFGFGVYNAGNALRHNHNNDINIGNFIERDRHIEKRKNVLLIDGIVRHTSEINTFACAKPMLIYAMSNQSGGANRIATAASNFKVAKFDIYDNDTKVRELVPFVRNNENGLIDLLTGIFYTSQGTGSFTITTESK